MELTDAALARDDRDGGHQANEPSIATALEHLVTGSQGVITKRIDLALLEGQELLARTLQRAASVVLGVAFALAAWFALLASLVLFATPGASLVVHMAAFGLLNAGGAVALLTLAQRAKAYWRVGNGSASASRVSNGTK